MDTIEGATVLVGSDAGVLAELADAMAAAGPLVVAGPTAIGMPEADPARAVIEVDVRSQADLDAAARHVVERWGPPSTLVVAPAPAQHVAFEDLDERTWSEVLDANLGTATRAVRAFGPALVDRGRASVALVVWRPPSGAGAVAVAAVSGAITLFARSLAADLGASGVTVNAIRVPGDGIAAAASAVALLRSRDAGYLTAEILDPVGSRGGPPA